MKLIHELINEYNKLLFLSIHQYIKNKNLDINDKNILSFIFTDNPIEYYDSPDTDFILRLFMNSISNRVSDTTQRTSNHPCRSMVINDIKLKYKEEENTYKILKELMNLYT